MTMDNLNQNVKKEVSTDELHRFFSTLYKVNDYAKEYQEIFNEYLRIIKKDTFAEEEKIEYTFSVLPERDDEIVTPSTFLSAQLDDDVGTDVLYILLLVHIGVRRMLISKVLGPRLKASITYRIASSSGLTETNKMLRDMIDNLEMAVDKNLSDEKIMELGLDPEIIRHVKERLDSTGLPSFSDFSKFMKFFDVIHEPTNESINKNFYEQIYAFLNNKPTNITEGVSEMSALRTSHDVVLKSIDENRQVFNDRRMQKEDIGNRFTNGWSSVVDKAKEHVTNNFSIFFDGEVMGALVNAYGNNWFRNILTDVKKMTVSPPIRPLPAGPINLPYDANKIFGGYLTNRGEMIRDGHTFSAADEYILQAQQCCKVEFFAEILGPQQHNDVDMYLWWTDATNAMQVNPATTRGPRERFVYVMDPVNMTNIRLVVKSFEGTFTYQLILKIIP